jgi:hypothetical protein
LIFEKTEPLLPGISLENFGLNRVGQGLLSFSADGLESSAETGLFKVFFRTRGEMVVAEPLGLTHWPTPGVLYTQEGAAFRPVLDRGKEGNTSVLPNPFGVAGTWVLTENDQDLNVFDASGRLVFSKKIKANSALFLESGLFPHAGIYFWQVGEKSGKLIFIP